MSDNFDHLLGGRSVPSATFAGNYPILWEGYIDDVTENVAYEYDPSKPNNRGAQRFWPDGNPVMNLWITLRTEVRVNQDDDGRRVLVLDSKNKKEAVQEAVRASGASFAKNGYLRMEWYGVDPNGKNPQNPPKLYRAQYTGPSFDQALAGQSGPTGQPAQGGWGGQAPASAPASPAPATGGWGSPPPQTPPAQPSQNGWGAPSGPGATAAPAAPAQGGWGSPPPQAPAAEPDPQSYDEFVAAFKRKGVDPSAITSAEQAAQVWALVKNNPNVA